jgi:hypothetical protein
LSANGAPKATEHLKILVKAGIPVRRTGLHSDDPGRRRPTFILKLMGSPTSG